MPSHQTADEQIIAALTSDPPPLSTGEIATRINRAATYVHARITTLLKRRVITPEQVPWRNPARRPRGPIKPRGRVTDTIDHLQAIANENGRDRVAALRAILDAESIGRESTAPPLPADDAGKLAYLAYMMESVGSTISRSAFERAFTARGTILPDLPPSPEEPFDDESLGEAAPS